MNVDSQRIASVVNDAGAAILAYMDNLAAGLADRPMRLLPSYRALLQARGMEHVSASDLFYPDLHRELPDRPSPVAADHDVLRSQKRRFEGALLRWLQNTGDAGAIDDMCTAVAAVESSRSTTESRAPWCAALAALEATAGGVQA